MAQISRGIQRLQIKPTANPTLAPGNPFETERRVLSTDVPQPGCPHPKAEGQFTVNRAHKEKITSFMRIEQDKYPDLLVEDTYLSLFSDEELKKIAVCEVSLPLVE